MGLSRDEIISLLAITDQDELMNLYQRAYDVKLRYVGNKVYFRGLIELSNICDKNCFYCGIRKDNSKTQRYEMSFEEAINEGLWAYENRYGSVVIQGGERSDRTFTSKITKIISSLKEKTNDRIGITLSLGEQERGIYEEWYNAGAHRYLLRVETSNRELYKKCHPPTQTFDRRLEALQLLKEIGFQVGTGVMIGLPGQTIDDLADDIIFFKDFDVDMIGMGPFIPHSDTPLGNVKNLNYLDDNFTLGLKMIAVTRLHLKDVNIASTTALQTLNQEGRELGLKAGANVIMPNITETRYRKSYSLYNNKPHLDENAESTRQSLEKRINDMGEIIGYDDWGDSPHYFKKINR
jgi:biotin synthase